MEGKKVLLTDSLNSVKIVLVGTTHPGNIGAAARAMKNMGLSRLALINPKRTITMERKYKHLMPRLLESSSVCIGPLMR